MKYTMISKNRNRRKNDMDLFLVSDKKPKDTIYVMLNSFKQSKLDETQMNFHLVMQDVDDQLKEYFNDLNDSTFHLHFIEAKDYAQYIHPPVKTYLYYVRCLAPRIFPNLDKILYLDTDTVCINTGIEELWNTDISTKFLGAATDIQIQYNDAFQRLNTKNEKNYWNSGVMLINLKKWRDQGYDKKIEEYLLNWPKELKCVLFDQTLLNYVFKDDIKKISSKYNSSILAMVKRDEVAYMNYYQTTNLINEMNNAVIVHMKGPKPWQQVHSWQVMLLPHRVLQKEIYFQLYHQLGKPQEF